MFIRTIVESIRYMHFAFGVGLMVGVGVLVAISDNRSGRGVGDLVGGVFGVVVGVIVLVSGGVVALVSSGVVVVSSSSAFQRSLNSFLTPSRCNYDAIMTSLRRHVPTLKVGLITLVSSSS